MIDSALDLASMLAAPLAAGLLALLTHVPLGEQVLRRGIVFIDLAIAQIAALGVLAASGLTGVAEAPWWAGTAAALAGSLLVAGLARAWPEQREALIGLVYVGSAAAAVLWVSTDPHGAQRLRALLAGDILWVRPESLWPLTAGSIMFAAILGRFPAALAHDRVFYSVFAILISLSVPVLGLYLVFAALIAPALGANRLRQVGIRRTRTAAYAFGCAGFALGLALSYRFDWPSGPTVVLALIASAIVPGVLAAVRLRG